MRIVTRPDFDGIICAVLLRQALQITSKILWIEPGDLQSGSVRIEKDDILANLPYAPECAMWFDHHISNKPKTPFNGAFDVVHSAARVVYTYFLDQGKLDHRYDTLVENTDIIDGALLSRDQVRFPENHPYVILSMTIKNKKKSEELYWNRLVELFADGEIEPVMQDSEVIRRCDEAVRENQAFKAHLRAHTRIVKKISITDFRGLYPVPDGNRFLTYSLFPESIASVKIRYKDPDQTKVLISIGRNIFTPECRVNIGNLLARYGGGGHAGAGGCTLDANDADNAIEDILECLYKNEPIS